MLPTILFLSQLFVSSHGTPKKLYQNTISAPQLTWKPGNTWQRLGVVRTLSDYPSCTRRNKCVPCQAALVTLSFHNHLFSMFLMSSTVECFLCQSIFNISTCLNALHDPFSHNMFKKWQMFVQMLVKRI